MTDLDLYAEMTALADADEQHRGALARDLIRRISVLAAADRQTWRDAIRQVVPDISKTDFAAIVKEEREAHAAKVAESKAAEERARAEERLRQAVEEGAFLPTPSDPMAVARTLVKRLQHTDGVPHLAWWRGDFYRWTRTRWAAQQDATITKWLYEQTEHAIFEAEHKIFAWAPTGGKIANLREALGTAILARPWDDDEVRCVAVTNGVLDLDGRRRTLRPHSPKRFNLASLPFNYEAQAQCPQWLTFLAEVLPDDEEARSFLQEWFGYIVSGRTDLQKMADLYGAKRSGKGTIARVLEAMLGPELVASPSLSSLATQFGEQPLIGKSLAVLSDVNWATRDVAEAVEILKKISGEDSRDVNRKNRESWHGKLGVRFLVIGNDAPKFTDASGALAGRMIHVRFKKSFFGREDPTLTGKLLAELPGILNWSLDGLDRLTERGKFKVPASHTEAEREILRLTSPVEGFIQDRAILAPNASKLLLDDVYAAYGEWCAEEEGRNQVSVKAVFARDLRSAGNGAIEVRREKANGVRTQYVYGLAPAEAGSLAARPRTRADQQWLVGGDER